MPDLSCSFLRFHQSKSILYFDIFFGATYSVEKSIIALLRIFHVPEVVLPKAEIPSDKFNSRVFSLNVQYELTQLRDQILTMDGLFVRQGKRPMKRN